MNPAVVACLACCAAAFAAPAEQLSVKDPGTGITVRVKEDGHTLVATDKDDKALWEVDVTKVAGAPAVGTPVVRHLSLKGGNVQAVYGKHNFANFDLATGKLVASGSD